MNEQTLGEKLSPLLIEIENAIWGYEANISLPPKFTLPGFTAIIKILMAAMLDKMWDLQETENMEQKDRELMAEKCGEGFRQLVKRFTNIDTFTLYK